jgi:hypothetical protein
MDVSPLCDRGMLGFNAPPLKSNLLEAEGRNDAESADPAGE